MHETIPWLGIACITLSLLLAIAGVGWRRLAVALVVSALVAGSAAAGVGWVAWRAERQSAAF